jgi:hypothetical protein
MDGREGRSEGDNWWHTRIASVKEVGEEEEGDVAGVLSMCVVVESLG